MNVLCITPVSHLPKVVEVLEQCGSVTYEPFADKRKTAELIGTGNYEAVFVNPNQMTFRLDEEVLQNKIRVVATASTGTNHIDLEYCRTNSIIVFSLKRDIELLKSVSSTAELAFGLMLSLVRKIPLAFESAKRFEWNFMPFVGRQLDHLTVGVVGLGRLGTMFAHYCQAFGMKVLVCDPYVVNEDYPIYGLEDVLSHSDVISLHVHLKDDTRRMINKETLSFIKPNGAYLINTSRGEVVDEDAVIGALESGVLKGYGADVVADELGNIENSRLLHEARRLNVIITPHIGGATLDAQNIAYYHTAVKLRTLSVI